MKYETMIVKWYGDSSEYIGYIYNKDSNVTERIFSDCRFINDFVGELNSEGWFISAFEHFNSRNDMVIAFTRKNLDE